MPVAMTIAKYAGCKFAKPDAAGAGATGVAGEFASAARSKSWVVVVMMSSIQSAGFGNATAMARTREDKREGQI
jgi:hypothetical protein